MNSTTNSYSGDPYTTRSMQEICMDRTPVPQSFQDQYDEYARNASFIINSPSVATQETIEYTLRVGLSIMEYFRHSLQELDFYRMKYAPRKPEDVERSQIKNCLIGRCKCGQLLIQSKDRCCPKCNQFIDWTE